LPSKEEIKHFNSINKMILDKLSLMEQDALMQSERVQKRVQAIKSIQTILNQIDFSVEEVPIDNSDRFLKLLQSLKNDQLSEDEENLVDEIIAGK
jgi:hypothetical protein